MNDMSFVDPITLLLVFTVVLAMILMRRHSQNKLQQQREAHLPDAWTVDRLDRLERSLRHDIIESQRGSRQELNQNLQAFQQSQVEQLSQLQRQLSDTLNQQLLALSEQNARRLSEMRTTLDEQLRQLQTNNDTKLDDMRKTVDERLQTTLEARLNESFRQVAERLEQVHHGLGQMQNLAQGVGDLQRVLVNVKTRGIFGEVQLERLLDQVLTTDQYQRQAVVKPGSTQRVDFAIRLPGRNEGEEVLLPIDAKFPREDLDRLLDAQERADAAAIDAAGKALENRLKSQAKSIADHYLEPPHTTDFAILFLPTESLYAEALRRPGLMEGMQRDHRVTLAGPTTLLAMLNSFQMGFRTLALEKKASEVWTVLGAVKTEFDRYGEWVGKVREQVQKAADTLDKADTRHNQIRRVLRKVEALPSEEADRLLPGDAAHDPSH
jgi:DNA recombination protein RmuC